MGTSDKIEDLLNRNVEKIISKKHLFDLLKSKKKLRIKHGIDPTGPKIHLGRAIPLRKLKSFQDLGHQVVIIIGDFTAQIGDASDKHAMRQVLSEKQVKRNMKDYTKQIGKILDMDKVELRYNSEWLGKLSAKDLINLAMRFTAQQMIERRNFKERWDENKPIGFHELNYPLLQGYDSVAIKADVEIGGSDQLFNLGVGRVIQKMFSQKPQDVMLLKMLSGLDGRKMATSWGNIITIVDKSSDMYGKVMSIKDELITEYFEFATCIPLNEIEKIKKDLKSKKLHPRDAKVWLAKEIVALYHDPQAANRAEVEFDRVFKQKKLPDKMPSFKLSYKKLNVLEILMKTKLVSSRSEGKRFVSQKGVKIDGEIQLDWHKVIQLDKEMVIQVGKRGFAKIET